MKYFQYVASLRHNEDPDYDLCRKLLEKGLKDSECSTKGTLDFSRKGPVKRGQSKKANSTSPSGDSEVSISDTEPLCKMKDVVANGSQGPNKAKQHPAGISDSSSSAESDCYDSEDNEVDNYKKRAKSSNVNRKKKAKSVLSWRDCPSAIASNVNRAGEYKTHRAKKQKKTGV